MVLQAAASNKFKECYGVEKAETPAAYAKAMEEQFRRWMDWFGKTYTEFTVLITFLISNLLTIGNLKFIGVFAYVILQLFALFIIS